MQTQTQSPNDQFKPFNPWREIWWEPSQTIRRIVDTNPTRSVLPIIALAGIGGTLDIASSRSVGDRWPLAWILGIALILGPLGGLLGLYIWGALLRWTGSWFGGQATAQQVRAAMAWSRVPGLVSLALWIPLLALSGGGMLTNAKLGQGANPLLGVAAIPLLCIKFVLAIWSIVLQVRTLAEVHRFSSWRALAALFLPSIALVFVLGICFLLVRLRSS